MEDPRKEKVLTEFFQRRICTEEFARMLRRMNYETIRMVLRLPEDEYNKDWVEDGHFWLNEFCEAIDPQLEKTPEH